MHVLLMALIGLGCIVVFGLLTLAFLLFSIVIGKLAWAIADRLGL